MSRKLIAEVVVAGMLLAGSVFAETDYIAMPVINDIQKGVNNANQIQDLRVEHTARFGGNVTSASNITITAGGQTITAGGQTITAGGQTITAGDQTISAGTSKVDKVQANLAEYSAATIAGVPKNYFTFMDDFHYVPISTNLVESDSLHLPWKYTGDSAVESTLLVGATAGGVLKLTAGSTDNNEAYIQYGPQGTEGSFVTSTNTGKKLWYECRVTAPDSGMEGGFFVGLADPGSSAANFLVDDSGIVDTNKNHMGFWIGTISSNAYWCFQSEKADTALVKDSNIVTNTVDSYVRLGFLFNGTTTKVFVNGTQQSHVHTNVTATYPTEVVMSPIIALKTGTASFGPTGLVDYVWIQQER